MRPTVIKLIVALVLLIPLLLPNSAKAQDELSVAVVVLNKGRVPKRVWKSAKNALVSFFKRRDGFKIIGSNTLRRAIRRHRLAFFSYTEKSQFLEAGKRLGADLLVVCLIKKKGRKDYDIDLWYLDVKHSALIRRFSTECAGCTAKIFAQGFPQLATELFKPPYKLYLKTNPPGASIIENGKELGKTPFEGKIEPGNHTIRITLDGYETIEVEFTMPDDRPIEAEIELTPKSKPAVATAAAQKPQQEAQTQPTQPQAQPQQETAQKPEVAQAQQPQTQQAQQPKPEAEQPAKAEEKEEELEEIEEVEETPETKPQQVASAEPKQPPAQTSVSPEYGEEPEPEPAGEVQAEAAHVSAAKVWGMRLMWMGALVAGGGAVLTLSALEFDDDADRMEDAFPSDAQDARDTANSLRILSYAAYGTAAAAVITGSILFFTAKDSASTEITLAPSAFGKTAFGATALVRW